MEMKDKICFYKYFDVLFNYIYFLKCRFEVVGYGCLICVGNIVFLLEVVLNVVK